MEKTIVLKVLLAATAISLASCNSDGPGFRDTSDGELVRRLVSVLTGTTDDSADEIVRELYRRGKQTLPAFDAALSENATMQEDNRQNGNYIAALSGRNSPALRPIHETDRILWNIAANLRDHRDAIQAGKTAPAFTTKSQLPKPRA